MDFITTTVVTTDDICKELHKRFDYFDENIIRRAYAIMMQQLKKEGRESEIIRYLKVAYYIAQLHFGVDVVSTVFLVEAKADEDIVKDKFGITAMRVVREYQSISQSECSAEEWIKRYVKRADCVVSLRYAFLILVLMTIARFYEIKVTNDDERESVAKYIREYLLPIALDDKMYYFVDLLENICFDSKMRRGHRLVKKNYDLFIERNSYSSGVPKLLEEILVLRTDTGVMDESYDWCGCFDGVIFESLMPKEIYDDFCLKYSDIETELDVFFSKDNVKIGDIYLISSGKDNMKPEEEIAAFLDCHEKRLLTMGFAIIGVRFSERKGLSYFLLRDKMRSVFRIYVMSRYEYMKAKLGVMIDYEFEKWNQKTSNEVGTDISNGVVRVYDYGNNPWDIGSDTTVLDFAFINNERCGLCFKSAEVSGKEVSPDYVLCQGDCVKIITSDTIQPSLEWFKFIKTVSAKEILIKYFDSLIRKEADNE